MKNMIIDLMLLFTLSFCGVYHFVIVSFRYGHPIIATGFCIFGILVPLGVWLSVYRDRIE